MIVKSRQFVTEKCDRSNESDQQDRCLSPDDIFFVDALSYKIKRHPFPDAPCV